MHFDPRCLDELLPLRSAVVRLSCCCVLDRGHPCSRNFNSTVPVDVVRVKFYVNRLFYLACVTMRITMNKLYFSEGFEPGSERHHPLWNGIKFSRSCSMIVRVRVVLKRPVVGNSD